MFEFVLKSLHKSCYFNTCFKKLLLLHMVCIRSCIVCIFDDRTSIDKTFSTAKLTQLTNYTRQMTDDDKTIDVERLCKLSTNL